MIIMIITLIIIIIFNEIVISNWLLIFNDWIHSNWDQQRNSCSTKEGGKCKMVHDWIQGGDGGNF